MATHSSVLAWRIPGTGKPGGLPSLGSHRDRHDWSDLAAAAATKSRWRKSGSREEKGKWESPNSETIPNSVFCHWPLNKTVLYIIFYSEGKLVFCQSLTSVVNSSIKCT